MPESGGDENLPVPSEMEAEGEKVESIREGLGKRARPDHQVETTVIDERQANENKFWDDLAKGFGARPVRKDSDHLEERDSWMKMDLDAELRAAEAAAAACSSEDEDDEPGFDLKRFRDRWNYLWSGAQGYGDFEDPSKFAALSSYNI